MRQVEGMLFLLTLQWNWCLLPDFRDIADGDDGNLWQGLDEAPMLVDQVKLHLNSAQVL